LAPSNNNPYTLDLSAAGAGTEHLPRGEQQERGVSEGLGRAVAAPRQGTRQVQLPAGRECAHDRACALDMLMRIIEAGRTLDRKRQWLQLLSQDIFFTTQQVRETVTNLLSRYAASPLH